MNEKHHIQVDLHGKTALVTGGGTGIGRAIAETLAQNGATVIVHYNSSEGPAQEFVRRHPGCHAVQADLTDPEQIERMFEQIARDAGEVDLLVNNAGTQLELRSCEDMTLELWNRAVALNLTSAMLCAKHVISGMKKKGWGRVVNVSSISALSGGGPGGISYATPKGGINTFTKGLAKELGPSGVTVNAVAPGVILTAIYEKFNTKENLEELKKNTVLKRLGQPEDIAGVVLFLASDSAAYITGENIAVNGGLRMD
jgi:3-oxoacyl-[acyl-carrier protein] reductase